MGFPKRRLNINSMLFGYYFQVTLKKVDLTGDYSLYLNWKIDLDQYYCDALFIYRETKTSEVLMDHLPVRLNSKYLIPAVK